MSLEELLEKCDETNDVLLSTKIFFDSLLKIFPPKS